MPLLHRTSTLLASGLLNMLNPCLPSLSKNRWWKPLSNSRNSKSNKHQKIIKKIPKNIWKWSETTKFSKQQDSKAVLHVGATSKHNWCWPTEIGPLPLIDFYITKNKQMKTPGKLEAVSNVHGDYSIHVAPAIQRAANVFLTELE